ncbi:hypothetical protein [Nonomuraea jabiensis]|uniref:hypothetical protein n=1 Tax=Nonomuraea jabiensis TaxID=882448 RepID=UPI003D72FD57
MKVRVTGVVIEDDRILLLDQDTDTGRSWSSGTLVPQPHHHPGAPTHERATIAAWSGAG